MPPIRQKTDQDYEAENDAYKLIQAEKIKQDPARLKRAKQAAAKMVEERNEEVKAAKKVARKTPTKRTSRKMNTSGNRGNVL